MCVFTCSVHTQKRTSCYKFTNKLLQICLQAVSKLSSHCLFPVVITSLEQAVDNLYCNKLDDIIRLVTRLLSGSFFKDFPVGGGAFFEKGPFCEIIY